MSNQYVQTQVVCAVCGAVRGEANHYFLVATTPPGPIQIERYMDEYPPVGGEFPACGHECVLRLVAKNLEKL